METFGIIAQYYDTEEMSTYFPDLWTLIKHIGASHLSGAVRRWVVDQAVEHNVKVMMGYTAPPYDPTKPPAPYWDVVTQTVEQCKTKLKAHLDSYNISQYRDHPGVFGHILTGEPAGNYAFDPRNPPKVVLDLIEVIKYGVEYVKSLDPTHPVMVALNPAGAWVYDTEGLWIEKRKAWITRFIDFLDILDYHLYLNGDAGTEFWRNPTLMRSRLITNLDQVLIPSSKGKPIIIGETGCPSPSYKDWRGEMAYYTEDQQAEYFRIFGEETKARGIFVYVYKLIDASAWSMTNDGWGLFKPDKGTSMNIPKKVAGLIKEYLSAPSPMPLKKVRIKNTLTVPLKLIKMNAYPVGTLSPNSEIEVVFDPETVNIELQSVS